MKVLVAATMAFLCFAVPAALGRSAVVCSAPGEWPHTNDAAWLVRALMRAGLHAVDCTGSALVVDLGGPSSADRIYVWTTRGQPASAQLGAPTRVAGVPVRHDRVRGAWRARGRNVWVETASSRPLPTVRRWARVVRATLATPG